MHMNATSQQMDAPNFEAILAAHQRIVPHIHRTPVVTSASLDQIAGARLFFKCENLQKTGSFKIRGATNAVFSLTDEEARHGVVAPSSGNHAAALALAARWRGIPAYIVMPSNSSAAKKDHFVRAEYGFARGHLRPGDKKDWGASGASI
jgi:threonine dehydratase